MTAETPGWCGPGVEAQLAAAKERKASDVEVTQHYQSASDLRALARVLRGRAG